MKDFDYLSCTKAEDGAYPAYWNFDVSLCEFLAFNLRKLAESPACGTFDGWSDGAWKAFLLHASRRFEEYVVNCCDYSLSYEEAQYYTKRAQKALVDIAQFLPRLWD